VSLRARPAAAEDVAALLQELTGAGVAIEPVIEALGPDEGYILDEQAPPTLRAYLRGPVSRSRRAIIRRRLVAAGFEAAVVGRLRWRPIREEDWAEAWRAGYDIERVGRVVVRPAWRDYVAAGDGEVIVSLDPGMAFGTGQHPTTRMCLQAMEGRSLAGQDVLDLGCGSGILALAAVALAAERCFAVDIEEQAVAATVANVALNGAEGRIEVALGSIERVAAGRAFDLVLANINAATNIAHARPIHDVTRPGGAVIVSGIIAERAAACEDAFLAAGLRIEARLEAGDWRTFVLERPED